MNGLRDRFPTASVRLLSDMVEQGEAREVHQRPDRVEAAIVVALDRPLRVTPARGAATVLGPGAAYVDEEPLAEAAVSVTAAGAQPARYLALTGQTVRRAAEASSALSRVLVPAWKPKEATELLWLCQAPTLGAPLEALAQLIAAAIVRQFAEPAAILVVGPRRVDLLGFEGDRFVDLGLPLAAVMEGLRRGWPQRFRHLFVVCAGDPSLGPPAPFAALRFHRILYVSDTVPPGIPHGLERLLPSAARGTAAAGPSFCAFIPSVVPGGPRSRGPVSEPIDDSDSGREDPRRRAARALRRDACRIPFDLAALGSRWAMMEQAGAKLAFVAGASPAEQAIADRWARAVTNRQVGLALSGGGATSYRIVPLIRMLHERGVPIDVVSGVSGGALIGAYYCWDGLRGLETCVARGGALQAGLLAAVVRSELMEMQLGWDLGPVRVEETDVRFVAVTTALRHGSPPQAHAVVRGPLARAVRLSGSAPIAFAPSRLDGIRYTDGATATPVPVRAAREYGADVVFACNSIPGPARGNPLGRSGVGRFLYDHTVIGRALDLWTSAAFLLQRVSEEASRDADVFFEPPPDDVPFLECFQFYRARSIVRRSARSASLRSAVAQCEKRWRRFASVPKAHA